jgi:predicted nucleic acid-binding protein
MSGKRFSLDANVLVYSIDRSSPVKHKRAIAIVDGAADLDCVLTTQALGEFFFVSTRKGIVSARDAAAQADGWLTLFPTAAPSPAVMRAAFAEVVHHRFAFWDAMLLATANDAGCELVLSEDMHDGARFGNLTVRNPFAGAALADDIRAAIGLDA